MILKRIVLAFCLMTSANASLFKLADVFISSNLLKQQMAKTGVRGASINELGDSINVAVDSLKRSNLDFYKSIETLKVERIDKSKKNNLLSLMRKDNANLSNEEFVEAINDLFYLSQKYGKGAISCSSCNADDLKLLNINTRIKRIGNKKLSSYLTRIPKNKLRLNKYIKSRLINLGLQTNLSRLKAEDSVTFALFLNLAKTGSKDYQEFAKSVIAFNKVGNKKSDLVGRDSLSSIWKIVADEISIGDLNSLTTVLNKVSKLEPGARETAFYDELFKLAGNDPEKVNKVRRLKSNNCYFK